ncbi:MAG: hypothetical protein AUI63_00925 [Gemmatimonadetes bacterium 13_1_40CM_2_60_3]|nr:MAG: hypothetical protein AUI63_00925 [Gemmatimonadetes bacterium 13_1_40CM_2_60_3]
MSRPSLSRIPGVPGVPVGGVAGGAGVIFRVVSRGSWACAFRLAAKSNAIAAKTSATRREEDGAERAELVVCVSLTRERTVYFTP